MNQSAAPAADQSRRHIAGPEGEIYSLWREVLQLAEIPAPNDNFFALGGDSMAMVTLEFRVQEELGVSLPAGTLLGTPTVGEFVALVCRELRRNARELPPPTL